MHSPGGVRVGAADVTPVLSRITIPERKDSLHFCDTVRVGAGRGSPVLGRVPIPERRENLRFAGEVHTGGHGGVTTTTMPIPELRGE